LFDSKKTAREADELEKKHAVLVKKLKISTIKAVDKVQANEVSQFDVQKVDVSALPLIYYRLNAFGDKIGRDAKNEPEYFFKGLVKLPTKKELDAVVEANPELTARDSDDEVMTPKSPAENKTERSERSDRSEKDESKSSRSVKKETSEDKTEKGDSHRSKSKSSSSKLKRDPSDDKVDRSKVKKEPTKRETSAEVTDFPKDFVIQLETGGRSQVPFVKDATVRSGIEKIASSRGMKVEEWMYVTLSGQPVDVETQMSKVPGFAIMCVKKS
jgi:hypothetical protein